LNFRSKPECGEKSHGLAYGPISCGNKATRGRERPCETSRLYLFF
jgi:hypothetical protein